MNSVDETINQFIREAAPTARESLSSVETLIRINPEMLPVCLEFCLLLGFRAAFVALKEESKRTKIEGLLRQGGIFDLGWRG